MKQIIDIFIFINPKSGSKKGAKLLEAELKKVEIEMDNTGTEVVMHLINLTIPEKKTKAMKEMCEL
jgi:diacylglycerol kinase family enzyme